MDFSVIIPTYNDWERLEKCVGQLLKQGQKKISFEIIVVDNAPLHVPPDHFDREERLKIIHEPDPGSYSARNKGASIATGQYLAFTDADCLPAENWLTEAKKVFKEQECDLIGGRIDLFKEDRGGEWAYIYEKYTAFRQFVNVPRGRSVTANFLIYKNVFEQLGGFNQNIKSGGDWEFSKRAEKNNYKLVYADKVRVYHPARKSIKAIFKKQKRFAAWGYINTKRKFGHSGIRMLLSDMYHGIRRIIDKSRRPDNVHDKFIVIAISSGLYFQRIILKIFILIRVLDPGKVRE